MCIRDRLTPIWILLGLALFELGRFTRKGFLRWQGYILIALAFGRYGMNLFDLFGTAINVGPTPRFSFTNSLLLELLFLASAGYVLLERTTNRERCTRREYVVGLIADALGTLSIALWFAYRLSLIHILLDSLAADLVLMLLVAAGMVGHSLRYRSQTVTGLAFMLGFRCV